MFRMRQFTCAVRWLLFYPVIFGAVYIPRSVDANLWSTFNFVRDHTYCAFEECCTAKYIKTDIDQLRNALDTFLFGQHIAKDTVIDAIGGHLKNIQGSEKPLVMSLQGLPGTGKNYITEHIVQALYKNGATSNYVHKYRGRIDFPLDSAVESYKVQLVNEIQAAIKKCPKSLFIFDEVEKMPAGLFNSLVSLLDNHAYTKKLDFRQAIFIFLSNMAGPEIAQMLKKLLQGGTWRIHTKLADFEPTLEIASYNLDGGLYRSELIESHVIDHFVPFLPLEVPHVERCIAEAYRKIAQHEIDDKTLAAIANEAITLDETGMFSNNGCKRVGKKVESYYYRYLRTNQRDDL